MTKEEYISKMQEDENWTPGWDAIEEEFDRFGQKIDHYMTTLKSRVMFGGNEWLDGYSIYADKNGYLHFVTFGMSELYANEKAFGKEYSGWGYEMTFRVKEKNPENCLWAMNMLGNLARYTNQTGNCFYAGDYVIGDGSPLHIGSDSLITSLLIVNDVKARTLNTVHGKLEFLQLVGITWKEVNAIREDYSNFQKILERMKTDNPELITDMARIKSYL